MDTAADQVRPTDVERRAMQDFFQFSEELNGFMLIYQFGLEEMLTKINILKQELSHASPTDSPIEHVTHRLKRPESIAGKAERLGCDPSFDGVRAKVWDIAGIRVICSFVSDAYTILEMLRRQPDVTVVRVKDYIADPKPSGYKSLHLIADIPVFLSERTETVRVEIQIRTVAMDFWASLEHKIHYKYHREVPVPLRNELISVAAATERLDQQMEKLHRESRRWPDVLQTGPMPMALPDGEPEAGPWRVVPFTELVELVLRAAGPATGRPRVVAVDGRSAGGKSTLADGLADRIPDAVVVHTDDVAWHHSFFGWTDLLASGVLEPVRAGSAVRFRPPAWDERERPGAISVPTGTSLVLVEGVGAGRRELAHLLDALVWVQSDATEAERRGIARDTASGVNGDAEESVVFWHRWMRDELPFQADQRPWERACVVVAGTPPLTHGPDEVVIGLPVS